MVPTDFYLIPSDVFRLGNTDTARLGNVRSKDVDTLRVSEIVVVVANGKGVSVLDRDAITRAPFNGWVWKLPVGTALPPGLKLVSDKPGHYCIAPVTNMPIDKYKGLLEELGLRAQRIVKKSGSLAL
jgi:hypothetical protein